MGGVEPVDVDGRAQRAQVDQRRGGLVLDEDCIERVEFDVRGDEVDAGVIGQQRAQAACAWTSTTRTR